MRTATIVIADDEPHVTALLKFKLEAQGHRVHTARNGREAVEAVRRESPDLVVTDLQMPGMNGFELAMALRDDPATRDLPVLMLSARGHKLSGEELDRTNIRQILPKPFSPREIVDRVRLMLEPEDASADDAVGEAVGDVVGAGVGNAVGR